MALESVGFEPTTAFYQFLTLKSVIFNFNFHTCASTCQGSHYHLGIVLKFLFYEEKVPTLLTFAESGNNSSKFGKNSKSAKNGKIPSGELNPDLSGESSVSNSVDHHGFHICLYNFNQNDNSAHFAFKETISPI